MLVMHHRVIWWRQWCVCILSVTLRRLYAAWIVNTGIMMQRESQRIRANKEGTKREPRQRRGRESKSEKKGRHNSVQARPTTMYNKYIHHHAVSIVVTQRQEWLITMFQEHNNTYWYTHNVKQKIHIGRHAESQKRKCTQYTPCTQFMHICESLVFIASSLSKRVCDGPGTFIWVHTQRQTQTHTHTHTQLRLHTN